MLFRSASGAAAGLLALQAIIDDNIRWALIWLVVCQVLDGLDGPIARRIDVVFTAPRVDGCVLDLIVDYVTCVVVPVMLLLRLELLPHEFQTLIACAVLLLSALWFARTDIETEDHWFNGFPAIWEARPTLNDWHGQPSEMGRAPYYWHRQVRGKLCRHFWHALTGFGEIRKTGTGSRCFTYPHSRR